MKYVINSNGSLVIDTENNISIPADTANRHYQEYLAWVADGNVAEILPEETYD